MGQVKAILQETSLPALGLGPDKDTLFRLYFQELVEWNRSVNLTAIVGPGEVASKHFLDSLSVARVTPDGTLAVGALADVGSGAGFPGLPLKIAWPGLHVTLIESVGKKAAFLRHIVETLGLDGVEVENGRAETLAHEPRLRERFDVVTARAVAHMAALAELTLPFCRPGGMVVAQKKAGIDDELKEAEAAIALLGGTLERIEVVDDVEPGDPRWLVVLRKVAQSPDRYPRRPGIPAKRPLTEVRPSPA